MPIGPYAKIVFALPAILLVLTGVLVGGGSHLQLPPPPVATVEHNESLGHSTLPAPAPGRVTPSASGLQRYADVANLSAGNGPIQATFDAALNYTYVVNPNSGTPAGSVSVVRDTTVIATIGVGRLPLASVLDDQTGVLYVANYGSDNVSVINRTAVVGTVAVGFSPDGIAFDPADGFVYVLDGNHTSVAVVNGTTVLATLQVGMQPWQAVFDPSDGDMYVANSFSNVTVLNGTHIVGVIDTGGYPGIPAYDPSNGDVYVPTGGPNVSVIHGLTLVTQLSVFPATFGSSLFAAYDAVNGQIYVTSYGSDQVAMIRNLTVLASVAVGQSPQFAVVDPSTGWVLVLDASSSQLSVLNATTLIQTISVGASPWGATFDPVDDQVDVAVVSSNSLDIFRLVPAFTVDFVETGLASGTAWTAVFGGIQNSSTGSSVGFVEPNGSYSYTVEDFAGYFTNPNAGTLAVSGLARTIPIAFEWAYPVNFTETGLALGRVWTVNISGSTLSGAAGTILSIALPNGTYSYAIGSEAGYQVGLVTGPAVVDGSALAVPVSFVAVYGVTLTEVGLPLGTNWSGSLNGETLSSTTANLTFQEPDGNYTFVLGRVPGWTTLIRAETILVRGGPVEQTIGFSPATCDLTFRAAGLPPGTFWWVNVSGMNRSGGTPNITFAEPNGSYSFAVGNVSGYTALPTAGNLTVNGTCPLTEISFTGIPQASAPPTFLGFPVVEGYAFIAGVVALIAVALAVLFLRKRGGKQPAARSAPSE